MYHACSPSNENIFLTPAWSSTVRNSIQKPTLQAEMLVWVHNHYGVMLVLYIYIYILSTWYKLKSSGKRKPQLKKNTSNRLAYRQVCRTFSWLVINVGGYRLLWAVPSLARWPRQQAALLHACFLLLFLPPGFHSIWLPALSPFNDNYDQDV